MIQLLKSKIHRATVRDANVDYEGSVTIDPELMRAADLVPYEKVAIWDVTNGSRLETYVIEGEEGSGDVTINGAAAHLIYKGDIVIIASFFYKSQDELDHYKPKLVYVDANNKITHSNAVLH